MLVTLLLAGIVAAPLGSASLFIPAGAVLARALSIRVLAVTAASRPDCGLGGISMSLKLKGQRILAAVAGTGAALAVGIAGCGGSAGSPGSAGPAASGPGAAGQHQSAAGFLTAYARADGQVVRLDQGDDTVSEGQAYGMLLAEVSGNAGTFWRIWDWTQEHLQQRNGLFAYLASPSGQVTSSQPASDADVLIAWALLRYQGQDQATAHRDGERVASAVLAHEVTTGPGGVPVLAAGPWATGRPASLDPSYWSLPALQGLAQLTGNAQWSRLASGAVTLTSDLTQGGKLLPPDWAELTSSGALQPEAAPSGNEPQAEYGPDAQRVVAWFAVSCDAQARSLAARWWPMLRSGNAQDATSAQLNGTVLDPSQAALALVASAAAAKAAGDAAAASGLLQRAAQVQHHYPTYYGGAWDALGTALLTGNALSSC
jgi:endoglucanase